MPAPGPALELLAPVLEVAELIIRRAGGRAVPRRRTAPARAPPHRGPRTEQASICATPQLGGDVAASSPMVRMVFTPPHQRAQGRIGCALARPPMMMWTLRSKALSDFSTLSRWWLGVVDPLHAVEHADGSSGEAGPGTFQPLLQRIQPAPRCRASRHAANAFSRLSNPEVGTSARD